jgi:integrase
VTPAFAGSPTALSALRKGTLAAPNRATLEDAAREWLAKAERGEVLARTRRPYKPSSLRGYRHDLETYTFPLLGGVRFSELRRRDVQALVDRLIARGLSGSKVRNVIVPLQAMYRHGRARDAVTVDPTEGLELPESGGRRERAASPEEAFALIDALPDDLQALWATAAFGGLRRGELRALRVADVDYPAVTTIAVTRGYDDVEGPIEPKSQKGKRTVPVPAALRRYLLAEKLRTGRDGDDLLFGRTAHDPFTPTHVRKLALRAWAAANEKRKVDGLPPLVPLGLHEARHTYVSLIVAAGTSLEEAGDYIGHSSAYMTDRYRHLIEGQHERAADRLDAFLAGAQTGAQ